MGLFDRIRSDDADGASDPDDAPTPHADEQSFSFSDLSDEVTVWFADPWPTEKPLGDYQLVFLVDPQFDDPIIYKCDGDFAVPEGTKLLAVEQTGSDVIEGVRVRVVPAMLVQPALAEHCPDEFLEPVPASMDGTLVQDQTIERRDFLDTLSSVWAAGEDAGQADQ